MTVLEGLFWGLLALLAYPYLLYPLLLALVAIFRRPQKPQALDEWPAVTFIVAACNEQEVILDKVANTFAQEYPPDRIALRIVNDGSTDRTAELLHTVNDPRLTVLTQDPRQGKTRALLRGMQQAESPVVVFSDANSMLNPQAAKRLVARLMLPGVGLVAGRHKVRAEGESLSSAVSEQTYWNVEGKLKVLEARVHSVMGAAGSIYAVRTACLPQLEPDTLMDDFVLSLRVAIGGHRLAYEPGAWAEEPSSKTQAEEWRRRLRISAGTLQGVLRLGPAANPLRNPVLAWQFWSHRILRGVVGPFLLLPLFVLNAVLAFTQPGWLYPALLAAQGAFYLMAALGSLWPQRGRLMLAPYLFCFLNFGALFGILRHLRGRQSVLWERVRRA